MKYYLDRTVHATRRIYVSNPTLAVRIFLSNISIWGNTDKQGEGYLSWELSYDTSPEMLERVLCRLQCYPTLEYDWIK